MSESFDEQPSVGKPLNSEQPVSKKEWSNENIAKWIAEKITERGLTDSLPDLKEGMQEYLLFRRDVTNRVDTGDYDFLPKPMQKMIREELKKIRLAKEPPPRVIERNAKTKPKNEGHPLFPDYKPGQNEIRNNKIKGLH